jgi:putative ABC transport system ATP-binding protein
VQGIFRTLPSSKVPFMLHAQKVTKVYTRGRRPVNALRGVSLQVAGGEFLSLMGPSGSGKSTLLHLLGALDSPTSGRILLGDQDLADLSDKQCALLRRDRIGFVFQAFNLLPSLTAAENVALPLLLAGQSARNAKRKALVALDEVGLVARAGHCPDELSGGEMQRVAVARTLVTEPDVVLCDEPTGNLDTAASAEILRLLRQLPKDGRRAVIMVTHDARAAGYGDRIVHLRDGQIEAEEHLRDLHAVAA